MAITPFKTWISGEVLTASDLNSSFSHITSNAASLISPLTAALDMNGLELILDADADTSITADTDDIIHFKLQGSDLFIMNGATATAVNGLTWMASAAGSAVQVQAHGSDTDISINLVPKGAGTLQVGGTAVTTGGASNTFTSTDAGATVGPVLILDRNSASPAAADVLGGLQFKGRDSGAGTDTYAQIQAEIVDQTAASEDGRLAFHTAVAGTSAERLRIDDAITASRAINRAKGADIASAATTNIWATDGNSVHVTGTTTITSFGTAPQAGAERWVTFDGALVLTHGTNLNLPGAASITTAAGDVARVFADTTTQFDVQYFRASGRALVPTPPNPIRGMGLSNNGTDANNDIDIAAGDVISADGLTVISLAAGVTRQLDAAFGTGNGGLASNLSKSNSTFYAVHAVIDSAGAASIGFDTSATAANLISSNNILAYRRIGYVVTDGSGNIRPFLQKGRHFYYTTRFLDHNGQALTNNTPVQLTMSVPPDLEGMFNFGFLCNAIVSASIYPVGTQPTESSGYYDIVETGGAFDNSIPKNLHVNSSRLITVVAYHNGTCTLEASTIGWIDPMTV